MRSYLIYDKTDPCELPLFLAFTRQEAATFIGCHVHTVDHIVSGRREHARYGIYVDVFDPAEEHSSYYLTIYHKSAPPPSKSVYHKCHD